MREQTFLTILFLVGGAWSFLGAALSLPIFVNNRKYRGFASLFGEGFARLFYMGVGLLMFGGGLVSALGFVKFGR